MQRRLGFVVSTIGMVFVLLSLSKVLDQQDFMVCAIGFAFVVTGVFFAVESVARGK